MCALEKAALTEYHITLKLIYIRVVITYALAHTHSHAHIYIYIYIYNDNRWRSAIRKNLCCNSITSGAILAGTIINNMDNGF